MKKLIVLFLMALSSQGWSQKLESMVFREKTYDFGNVVEGKGIVDHEFVFTNTSGLPVKILSVQPSCGCTTPEWSRNSVLQGKTGFIKASFDPRGRPGYFNKSLTVVTDQDPNPIILQIKGVVKTQVATEKIDFSVSLGNLLFTSKSFNFDKVYINKEPVQKTFPIMNAGTAPIELVKALGPAYLKVEMPLVIGPKAKGVIKVTYDPKKKNQFGFASDNIQINTNDPGFEVKLIPVYATIEEFYAVPSLEEAKKGPILVIKEPIVDLGRFRQGENIDKVVLIVNAGKKTLLIKAIQGNCACIVAEVDKKSIFPGDSTHVKISFKPQNRSGTQMKAVTIYSNDPLNSVQRINVQAYVED